MVQLHIITVGNLSSEFKEGVGEYEKRLSSFCSLNNINIKEVKINDEDNQTQIQSALSEEADKIIAKMPQDAYKIALCVEGVQKDSVALADVIRQACDTKGKICLVIGSSHGLDERVKAKCDLRLSVSKLTFPHQLMRLILLEALYRSFAIMHGRRYHK